MNALTQRPARNLGKESGRGYALCLLFLASVLNLFDRQVINIIAQDIKADLGLTDLQLGLLTGTAFGLFYGVLGVPLAYLADRTNRVRLIAGSVAIWSLLTASCGFANSFGQLAFLRMGVGIGEAGCVPASTALVADRFPPQHRSGAMGLLFLGVPLGSLLGLLIGGMVGQSFGWRAAFLVAGGPGILLAGLILLSMREHRREADLATTSAAGSVRMLLANASFRWLLVGGAFATSLIYVAGAWLPAFLIREHGLTTAQVGGWCGLAVGLGGAVGTLGAGLLADRLRPYVAKAETLVPICSSLVAGIALLIAVNASGVAIALVMVGVFYAAAFAWMGPATTRMQAVAGEGSRSLAIGLQVCAANLFSLLFCIPAVGWLSDRLAGDGSGAGALGYALSMAAVAGPVAAFAYWRTGDANDETARIRRKAP